jgi:hypothetical protein
VQVALDLDALGCHRLAQDPSLAAAQRLQREVARDGREPRTAEEPSAGGLGQRGEPGLLRQVVDRARVGDETPQQRSHEAIVRGEALRIEVGWVGHRLALLNAAGRASGSCTPP